LSLHDWEDGPVIAPDGRTVAFTGVTEGTRRLYVRPVNASVIRPLPGTEGAMGPFWSPDGRAIGFSVYDQIQRVDVAGGAVVTLGEHEGGFTRTGTWNGEGVVLFDGWFNGWGDPAIRRVGERGMATAVTRLDAPRKERSHGSPQFLPDGQHFLYFADAPEPAVYVGSLGSTNVTPVANVAAPARYAAGHLLYTRQRTLMARPFDPVRLEFRGAEFPLADGVVSGRFSASQNGTIAYRPAESDFMTLVWFDRHGSRHGTLGVPAEYRQVALSPSGARVAVVRGEPDTADLWMAETAKGVFSRLTRDPGRESDPAWSPDERYLAYSKTDVSLGADDVGLVVVRKDLVT
jgi:dipeptidyl aminopeptidase/acylaminoacyl peptidase